MAKVSRAYIKSAGQDQSGSIQAGSTIYAQDILDLIDSAKWHDEGIESVYYDDTSHGIEVVKSSDPGNPVFIPVPKNSDIVNKLVKGGDNYELRSDSGLVAKTDLPSTLVTSVACDKVNNELKVSSTTNDSGITVQLPDSLKSAVMDGNSIKFTSLDGEKSVINLPDSLKSAYIEGSTITFTSLSGQHSSVVNLPDSLKSVAIDGNTLTFTHTKGAPSVIKLPVTTGYLSDVSLSDGTLVFTKDGSSDVRVTLPFVSKAITGVDLQGSNLVFTFSDNTSATITLPTQSEGGTTAGLLSGVRIDGNKLIFTVSGGNDITIELPSTSGDVDLTGLLLNPSYSKGTLSFDTKDGGKKTVDIDGITSIDGLSFDDLTYSDYKGNQHKVSLSGLTSGMLAGVLHSGDYLTFICKDSKDTIFKLQELTASGVLTGVSLSDGNLVFTVKGKGDTTIPLDDLTANGVLTGVSLSNGNLVFTVKGGDNITIPLSSSSGGVTDVAVTNGELSVTKGSDTTKYAILPVYANVSDPTTRGSNYGWGGSLGYKVSSNGVISYAPLWVPTDLGSVSDVLHSQGYLTTGHLSLTGTSNIEMGTIHGSYYDPPYGNSSDELDFLQCSLPFTGSLSESSGTFTANVITRTDLNFDYVLLGSYNLSVSLNGNILEALPSDDYTTVVHLLQKARSLSKFKGFAYVISDFVILIDWYMFFAKQVFDWSYNVTNSFGMRFYLSSNIEKYSAKKFTATAGKVLE